MLDIEEGNFKMKKPAHWMITCVVLVSLASCVTSPATPTAPSESGNPTSTPVVTPTPSTESVTTTGTPPTTQPPATEEPIPSQTIHLPPGQVVSISSIRMIDEGNGWGIGGLAGAKDHVLRTEDGGVTWIDVTPPEPASVTDDLNRFIDGCFLDFERAWIRYGDSLTVWFTVDGGESWSASELPDVDFFYPMEMFPGTIQFIDGQIGWLMLYLESGMSHQYINLYQTVDGGITWQERINPMDSGELQSCCKTGMTFLDAQTGLVTYEQGPYSEPHISWTQDGGITWQFVPLPSPFDDPSILENSYCIAHSPFLFRPKQTLLGVECRTYSDPVEVNHFLYSTDDWGENWHILPYPGERLLFLSPDLGMAVGPELHQTRDGGNTWTFVNALEWEGQLTFIDDQNGWAIVQIDDASLLLRTADGGRSWDRLEPAISP
jgi:photosystem II stability/assembly factor-like uncharacterized protein